MKLEHILLGTLLQRPMTGYGLKRFMDVAGRFMRDKTVMSQVYRSLGRMEEDGLVTHTVESGPGARDLKRYRVTPEGETVFFEWLGRPGPPAERPAGDEFFTRLRFTASFLDPADVLVVLNREIETTRAHIDRYRNRDRTEEVDPTVPMNESFCGMVMEWQHRSGVARTDVHLAGCVELRDRIAAGDPPTYGSHLIRRSHHGAGQPDADHAGMEADA